jgi:glycosyltransferase involved in cell wall biosynthesis
MLDITALTAKGTPLVVTYHTGSMVKGRNATDRLIRCYENLVLPHALRKARIVICAARFVQRSDLIKPYADKSAVVTPGIDLAVFLPPLTPRAGEHRILHVGGLKFGEEHKGLDTSLRVVAALKQKYPDVRLTVAGNGDKHHHYELLVEKLGIAAQIEFRGRLHGQELVCAYQRANVLIVPSRKDVRPLAVLEAMACGLPVVTTAVEGIPDLVEDGEFGFLVEPDDIDGFVMKISELFDDRALHKRLSENSRRVAMERECDWSRQAELTAQLLKPLIMGDEHC